MNWAEPSGSAQFICIKRTFRDFYDIVQPMDDEIIQIEVALNFINTLLAKANYFKDNKVADELNSLRHGIYYGETFQYTYYIEKLQEIKQVLNKYVM